MKNIMMKLSILPAIAFPLFFTLFWLIHNTQLPENDASNYLMTIVSMYQYIDVHGFFRGIVHSFFDRGWRPIIFPNLSLPFMLVTKGNLYLTYFLTAVSCILASLVYIYLYFRLLLSKVSSIILTNLVGLLPLIQSQVVMFYAESALFFCMLGSLYHLIKADYFKNKFHSCAFVALFSLSVLIRPVEAVTQLLFVFMLFFAIGFKKEIFNLNQLKIITQFLFGALSVFFAAALLPQLHVVPATLIDTGGPFDIKMTHILLRSFQVSAILFVLITMIMLLSNAASLRAKYHQWLTRADKNYFVPALIASTVIILFWYLPFAAELYQWIYRTSLGDVANSTGSLGGSQFSWDVLNRYVTAEGMMAVTAALLMAVVGFIAIGKLKAKLVLFSFPFIFLLLTLPFPLWESFYTVQIVTRKLAFAFPALIMALFLLGMQQGRWMVLRNVLLSLVVVAQFFLMVFQAYVADYAKPSQLLTYTVGYFIPAPTTISPNPHTVIDKFLLAQYGQHQFKSVALELNPGTPDARHFTESEPVDPFLQSTMAVADKRPFAVNYPYMNTDSKINIQLLKDRYDAIVLSDREDRMVISAQASDVYTHLYAEERSASLRLFYKLLLLYSQDNLKSAGYKVNDCITLRSKSNNSFKACLLLPA